MIFHPLTIYLFLISVFNMPQVVNMKNLLNKFYNLTLSVLLMKEWLVFLKIYLFFYLKGRFERERQTERPSIHWFTPRIVLTASYARPEPGA